MECKIAIENLFTTLCPVSINQNKFKAAISCRINIIEKQKNSESIARHRIARNETREAFEELWMVEIDSFGVVRLIEKAFSSRFARRCKWITVYSMFFFEIAEQRKNFFRFSAKIRSKLFPHSTSSQLNRDATVSHCPTESRSVPHSHSLA